MRSAGKVTNVNSAEADAKVLYKELTSTARITPETAERSNFNRAQFENICANRGGLRDARYSAKSPISSSIKGDTARVRAMADALISCSSDVAGHLLKQVIENIKIS